MTQLDVTTSGPNDYTVSLGAAPVVDKILFSAPSDATAVFLASQFGGTAISDAVEITCDNHSNIIQVNFDAPGVFTAAGWSFVSSTIADYLVVNGSTGADTITGGSAAGGNLIVGGLGADHLTGGSGLDNFRYMASAQIEAGETIDGAGGGFDVIQVNCDGSSYDFSGATIAGVEQVLLNLGGVNGSVTVTFSGAQLRAGAIAVVADGAFTSTVIVGGASVDLSGVDFQTWTDGVDTIKVNGTGGADGLTGSSHDDLFRGFAGGDVLAGLGGDDTFVIADAEGLGDSFAGGGGTDTLKVAGAGAATLAGFNAGASSIEKWDGNGAGVVGTAAADVFDFSGLASKTGLAFVDGGGGGDTLTGSALSDDLRGGAGNDIASGSAGNDALDGGDGDDALTGGAGSDVLRGGLGRDLMTGGLGAADTFDFDAVAEIGKKLGTRDLITDFEKGLDRIDLSTIDPKAKPGDQLFKFLKHGGEDFTGKAGELHWVKVNKPGTANDVTRVEGDTDGNGKADFKLELNGLIKLHATDFVL